MEAQEVSLRITWRMVRWGAVLGASLGALYPLFAVLLTLLLIVLSGGDAGATNTTMLGIWVGVGFGVGLALGGIAGIILGFLTGAVLAMVTYSAFAPIVDFHSYRRTMEIMSLLVGGIAALLLVIASGLPQYFGRGWGGEWGWLVWGVLPVLVATMATWWASQRITRQMGAMTSKSG
ncbi:MAG: hypothetical protein M3441_09595 [Chloroflexota bacterium]|nr:hypothetical protein [Chloroflexota bacterium]